MAPSHPYLRPVGLSIAGSVSPLDIQSSDTVSPLSEFRAPKDSPYITSVSLNPGQASITPARSHQSNLYSKPVSRNIFSSISRIPKLVAKCTNRRSISTPSTHDAPIPASASGPSPAQSYPMPNIQDHRGSVDGSLTPQPLNGPVPPNGPFASSLFKCTYSGCTAPPFQTQYLLKSHTYVHLSNRPHFCPVAECPRGLGGTGFKRKSEMIRHSLVHQSPRDIW